MQTEGHGLSGEGLSQEALATSSQLDGPCRGHSPAGIGRDPNRLHSS